VGTAHLINVGAREEPADELSVDLRLLQLVDDVIQNRTVESEYDPTLQ